ncbi:hypothetical protein PIB30_000378, partial [Stylosanthes scabra]|nr:hypothetical protein [Stylosanthes scabra]
GVFEAKVGDDGDGVAPKDKGAPSDPNWKPKTRRSKKGATTNSTSQVEVHMSSAP